MEGVEGLNWTSIIVALIGLAGIAVQYYLSNRHKKESDDRTATTNLALEQGTDELKKMIENNTRIIEENSRLIEDLTSKLSANDRATVSVVRQYIRTMYYELRDHKMISDTDYRAITELYSAYKGVTLPDGTHPNSWCDHLYDEMVHWARVEVYPEHLAHLNQTIKEREENGKSNG